MSQRRTKARPIRPDNIRARDIAACIQTPADLAELLASLENDKERAVAANAMKPYLPQFIHKRHGKVVVRVE